MDERLATALGAGQPAAEHAADGALLRSRTVTLPDFIIVGAMKSATSTLHEQLAAQPGIVMSRPKEPNFFSDDDIYARGLEWYSACFAGDGELYGESSTHYSKLPTHPRTVERLLKVVPDVRLIYVMRHPIDRLVSHYIHEWSEGRVRVSIDRAIGQRPELVDYGRYAMQLEPYKTAFGLERILPVFFDRLRLAPQDELARICRFVGYRGQPAWREERSRQNVSRERMRKRSLAEIVHQYPKLRSCLRAVLPTGMKDRIENLWRMRDRPQLSSEIAVRLADRFDADLAVLGTWLGAPLTCENFEPATSAAPLGWLGGAETRGDRNAETQGDRNAGPPAAWKGGEA